MARLVVKSGHLKDMLQGDWTRYVLKIDHILGS